MYKKSVLRQELSFSNVTCESFVSLQRTKENGGNAKHRVATATISNFNICIENLTNICVKIRVSKIVNFLFRILISFQLKKNYQQFYIKVAADTEFPGW